MHYPDWLLNNPGKIRHDWALLDPRHHHPWPCQVGNYFGFLNKSRILLLISAIFFHVPKIFLPSSFDIFKIFFHPLPVPSSMQSSNKTNENFYIVSHQYRTTFFRFYKSNPSISAIQFVSTIGFRFSKPEVLEEVAALEIIRDHSLYYKVRWHGLLYGITTLS